MVCGIALGILGDFAASEDAAQEAFLIAWRKLDELREPERLRSWLAQIARNAALGQLRRSREHLELSEELAVVDGAPGPAEAAATEEEAALVRASLARLPENYRLPLVLFYREGKSVHAVAEALELSEDAVKQRLARGREMLREQMSGLVETVLTRTGPTAIFTATIAVAIGALATPSAVAGSAFAAGASSAAVPTSPLLAIMSTSKALLAATAIVAVLCIPIGYHLRTGEAPAGAAKTFHRPGVEEPAVPRPGATFEDSALFAEWRALHERYGTNAQAMPALFKAVADMKDAFKRRAFNSALIAEWAQVDPAGGLKFFLASGADSSQRRQLFEEWLARDPNAAIDALLAGGAGWEKTARDCLPEIARQAPSRVPEIASRLPRTDDDYWDTNVRDAFSILAEGGLDSARKAAEAVTGPYREQALAGVALAWAKSDFNGAAAWARALPDGIDRNEILRAALVGEAAVDPVAALESAGIVPSGGRYAYFASSTGARVLQAAAQADFDTTVTWLAAHPGRFGQEDIYGLVNAVSERFNADPAGFLSANAASPRLSALEPAIENALLNSASGQRSATWEWLQTQPDNDATAALKRDVLRSAAWQDPALALEMEADLPLTLQGDAQVKDLAQALCNGGNALYRIDTLLPEAPERLREPLIEAGFHFLSAENLDNPQVWSDRLTLLPDAARAQATASLEGAWAQQSPEEAIDWAKSLPAGANRDGADAAIVTSWAAKDAQGAAEWVSSLPAGAERDSSAESLVLAVAAQHPSEAWQWALSIGDTGERNQAAACAAKAMAAQDPATARQCVESAPLSPDTKQEIEAAIAQPARTSNTH